METDATTYRPRPAALALPQGYATIARSAIYHSRTAILVFLVTLVLGVALALVIPAKYRSEARLLALPSDYYAVGGRDKSGAEAGTSFKPEELTNVEMQLLSSEDLQREVARRSGMAAGTDAASLEKARKDIARNLTIERVDGANVIELGYVARDPQQAARQLQTLLDVYFETRARVLTSGRSELIARQRDVAQRELDAAEAALKAFQEQNGIVDIQAQVTGAVAVDTALRQDLATTRADLSQTRGNAGRLRQESARVPRTVELFRDDTEATKAVADMQGQILALEAKRADLSGRYMQGSPLIEQIDKQIAGLRTAIDQQSGKLREARRTGRNTYYDAAADRIQQTSAAASGQAAKLDRLGQELSASQARLRDLNGIATTVGQLRTRRDVAEERYKGLTSQLEDARARELEASTGSTNVRVIQQPSVPDSRSNSRALLLIGAIAAGLLLAASVLVAMILRRDTILEASETVEALDLPVLLDLRQPLGASAAARIRSPFGAAARERHQPGRILAVVGAEPGAYGPELALLLRLLGEQSGDVAVLRFEEAAYRLERGALDRILPTSDGRSRFRIGTRAWASEATGDRLLASLRASFGWTVLMLPPADGAGTEAESLLGAAAMADDVVLLVRAEVSRRPTLQRLVERLRVSEAPLRGVVLTGRRIRWPRMLARFV